MTSVTPTTGWVEDYLARIGVARPVSADLQALRDLQAAHLLAVVRMRRGGFCYELNGAFAGLLTALGFRVSLLSARVFGAGEQPGPPFDHMTLRVDLAEPWLSDVGFGRFATQPLRLTFPGDQPDPSGTFRVADSPSGLSGDRLIVTEDGHREERTLTGDAEILAAYRRYFGITLDRVPVIAPAGATC
jgi:N-hydroxyarylamine O-acetyltransferase